MTIEAFRRSRIVVLRPASTVREAACAMNDNHVGAVLVCEEHRLVGIVTDRDLALHLASPNADPRETKISAIMTDVVVSCDGDATVADVVCAMRQYACRRIPIVENGRPVGIVTLDDVIAERWAHPETIRDVVKAQLERPSRFKPEGRLHPEQRRRDGEDRREELFEALLREVERRTGLSTQRASIALELSLGAMCHGMTAADADALLDRLPRRVRALIGGESGADGGTDVAAAWERFRTAAGLLPDAGLELALALFDVLAARGVRSRPRRSLESLFPPR
jgi:CBS domain-containing protein